jgi:2-iminobutanoate/2-iminopropanoate deaminase
MRLIAALGILAAATMPFQPSSKEIIRTGPDLGLPFSAGVKAGGLIYVSGTLATDVKGQIVPGDIKAQTAQLLDNIAATLTAGGSSLANAVSVMVYLRNAGDFAAMNGVYAARWPKDPPARTTVVVTAPLALPAALVEMSMVAVPNGAERRVVHPSDWMASPNPYSYGIKTGDTLFLSGLVSRSGKDNTIVKGDATAQTKKVLDNGGAILEAAGMSYADVVSARVFLADAATFQQMNLAYRPYFPAVPPARATARVGLTGADYLIEITMVAVKDASRAAIAPPGDPAPNPYLTPAIRVGTRLYLSGTLGVTPAAGGVKAQTAEALARIGRTLKAAGFDWSDLVDGVVYLPDMARFADMNGAYREVFTKDYPARATVGAGLMNPDGLVEIMFTAVK